MPRSKSSDRWLRRQARDPYVKRAQAEGARSRAHFKLAEIDARDKLLRSGMIVVDLGAAPGGWSQYAATRVGARGRVVAADLLPIAPISGVRFVHGDFADSQVLNLIKSEVGGQADLVMSDMAPNITGVTATDQARALALAELAADFAEDILHPGGSLLIKVFQGADFPGLRERLRKRFTTVVTRKPAASRSESREVFLLAKGFTG